MMDTLIRTENISKVFNPGLPDETRAVSDISIEINRGETAVLKGPSGSGKTTLLSLIGCMSRPTKGRIIINGKNVAKLPEKFLAGIRRKTFGFAFQHFNLIKDISVIENIMLPLYPTDIKLHTIRDRAGVIMEKLEIVQKKDFMVQQLSGGEQQRVAIARALINDPEIILADEPTAHLDAKLSEDLINILTSLKKEGRTVVIATHDPLVYERGFVDRVIEMRDGRAKEIPAKQKGSPDRRY